MDPLSADLARLLIQAPSHNPVLECHFPGPIVRFDVSTSIALTGAEMGAFLSSGRKLASGGSYQIQAGEQLYFSKQIKGEWAYLAIAGLQDWTMWLGSVDEEIKSGQSKKCTSKLVPEVSLGRWYQPYGNHIHFLPRPDFETFGQVIEAIVTSERNRMGYQVTGNFPKVSHSELSMGVAQGTIQLLPNSQAIVLMADHQTTGGYPVLGEVIFQDIGKLAQLHPGESFYLHPISLSEVLEKKEAWYRACRKLTLISQLGWI